MLRMCTCVIKCSNVHICAFSGLFVFVQAKYVVWWLHMIQIVLYFQIQYSLQFVLYVYMEFILYFVFTPTLY